MRLSIALLLIVLLVSAGCSETVGPDHVPLRELSPAEARIVEADNRFGFNVFRALNDGAHDENVFISPLSLSYALGMTLNGARGETRDEMLDAMELQGLSEDEINASYQSLMRMLEGMDPSVRFTIANSIWHRDDIEVREDFLDKGREFFDAEIRPLDFGDPRSPDVINNWIADETGGMIEEMIDEIDPMALMFLINAIYFKGDWRYQFDADYTRDGTFHTADGRDVTVPMMHQQVTLPFARGANYTMIDLPYGDSLFTMTILLPDANTDVNDIIASTDDEAWNEMTSALRPREFDLVMPRFEMEYEAALNDVLEDLGMRLAFTEYADLSGIHDSAYIHLIKQKAAIDVNEEGTEAAAATVVEVRVTSAPPTVRIDRPFVFAIRNLHTGTILFIGKAADVS